MFAVVVRLDVVDLRRVDWFDVVRLLDVKFREASLVLNETVKFGWRVILPSLITKPNTAIVMNVFTREAKFCPAFPSPAEAAADWKADSTGNYTVQVLRAESIN